MTQINPKEHKADCGSNITYKNDNGTTWTPPCDCQPKEQNEMDCPSNDSGYCFIDDCKLHNAEPQHLSQSKEQEKKRICPNYYHYGDQLPCECIKIEEAKNNVRVLTESSQPKEDWKKEWEKLKCFATQAGGVIGFENNKDIDFISELLATQKADLVKEFEEDWRGRLLKNKYEEGIMVGERNMVEIAKGAIKEERQSVLKEIEEKLPKERKLLGSVEENDMWRRGYNQCRESVLEILNKLK